MPSTKLLKERIESIQDTMKITNAMYLISSSKLRKARKNYQNVLPYFTRMRDTISRVVPHLPEEPVLIRADGALLWRVIDNLLSNICKYALPGTRLYISMERSGEQMTVQMKNVSRAPLNIPADELMERFVRGDSSRNSEGSGLGLSIAQSLTELMGGAFRLEIDGDLFKAKLDFPVILRPHG